MNFVYTDYLSIDLIYFESFLCFGIGYGSDTKDKSSCWYSIPQDRYHFMTARRLQQLNARVEARTRDSNVENEKNKTKKEDSKDVQQISTAYDIMLM